MKKEEMPKKFWNLLYQNGMNPNNYTMVSHNYEDFRIRDKRTGKVSMPIRY